jgi:hypothetical protein
MTEHKPTFKVSPKQRPWYRRLTPAAWVLMGVGLVVVVGAAVVAVLAAGDRSAEPWNPTPTASPVPSATPVLPTATPTVWWEGLVSPTPTATPAFPAWWSDQMTQDAEGRWWPPEGVSEMVEEWWPSYSAASRAAIVESKPPDYDALERAYYDWNVGWNTGMARGTPLPFFVDNYRQGIEQPSFIEWETCQFQVQDWSEDGLECTLGIRCQNGTYSEYDYRTGELLRQEHRDSLGLVLIRMRYDPFVGHWKQIEVVEVVPPLQ